MAKQLHGGRNIAALLGLDGGASALPEAAGSPNLVPMTQIAPDATNPRKHFDSDSLNQLAASLKEQGMLQPLLVARQDHGYSIVDGERRYRAALLAGLTDVPVLVGTFATTGQLAQARLTANVQRNSFTAAEEARAYLQAIKETLPEPGEEGIDRSDDGLPWRTAAGADGSPVAGYISNRRLASLTGIPSRRIDRALSLLRHPDLLAKVESGILTYAAALDTIAVRNETEKRRARAEAVMAPDDALPATLGPPGVVTRWGDPALDTPPRYENPIEEVLEGETTPAPALEPPPAPGPAPGMALTTPGTDGLTDSERIERYHRQWKPVLNLYKWLTHFDPASVPPDERKQRREGLLEARQRLDALIAQLGD